MGEDYKDIDSEACINYMPTISDDGISRCPHLDSWSNAYLKSSVFDAQNSIFAWVAPCAHVQDKFNLSDCASEEASANMTEHIVFYTATYTQLPSGSYIMGQVSDPSYADHLYETGIVSGKYTQIQVQVNPMEVSYLTNFFMNFF